MHDDSPPNYDQVPELSKLSRMILLNRSLDNSTPAERRRMLADVQAVRTISVEMGDASPELIAAYDETIGWLRNSVKRPAPARPR